MTAERISEAPAPLTAVVLHILLALAAGERHGYAIAREIEAATNDEIRMGPGTLYGSIQRMLAARLIEESARRVKAGAGDDGGRRRYYRMTAEGRRTLAIELRRLERIVALGRARRIHRGPEPA